MSTDDVVVAEIPDSSLQLTAEVRPSSLKALITSAWIYWASRPWEGNMGVSENWGPFLLVLI